jgi:hypothetical protein
MDPEARQILHAFHNLYYNGLPGKGHIFQRTQWMGVPCLKCPRTGVNSGRATGTRTYALPGVVAVDEGGASQPPCRRCPEMGVQRCSRSRILNFAI